MIDVYYYPTPNGKKVTIALEELGFLYNVHTVDILAGEQLSPSFLALNPNNKIPVIVDHSPPDGAGPLTIFESGVILQYLAEKTGRLMPRNPRGRYEVLQWLTWQVSGMGPILGQAHHFRAYATEKVPYAIDRFTREAARLYGVLDRRLAGRDFICDDYSIADIACWPWVVPHERHGQKLSGFPNVLAWFERVGSRAAVQRGSAVGTSPQ